MSFMQPEIEQTTYISVETTSGTETIPAELGR